ncbi:hypothetical protein MKW92_024302, partial [Papaver armeniacum]
YSALATEVRKGRGKVPVADYKVVKYVDNVNNGETTKSRETSRSCYSFCMCPGGQVVLTSTNPSELCINGMSFSRRSSKWAKCKGIREKSSHNGRGKFCCAWETVEDFLNNKLSETSLPSSSYRLGVKAAKLHELFPTHVTEALQHAISMFERELPGFISRDGLLHGVETRTRSPIQISRDGDTYESVSGLYPIGEGAGYAGGIVSAAGGIESVLGKAQKSTGFVKYLCGFGNSHY